MHAGPGCGSWRSTTVARVVAFAAALAAVCMLLGCAGVPPSGDTDRPSLPDDVAFEGSAAATVVPNLAIDRWWTVFEDRQLDARIAAALADNRDLAIAAARLREARALLDQAAGAQGPRLDLSLSSGRARASADATGGAAGASRTGGAHRVALVAGHELDLWGRLGSDALAARERLQVQVWARASIEWSLTAQVAEAHFALRAVTRQLDITRSMRRGRMREIDLRRAQHGAGSGAELDLRRAEAELATAEATLAALARRALALQNTLALLTGGPVSALVEPSPEPGVAVPPLDPERAFEARLPDGPLVQLLVRRPDVRQAEAALRAARADVASARAATLPAVRLTGSVGSDVRELSALFSGPGFAWSLASGVVQAVFDGGRAAARVNESEARSDAALAHYQQTVAAAVIDVREAYLGFALDADALAAQQQRAASLARALRLARTAQEAGVATHLDTLDAERHHFQAQLAEVDAYRDRLLGQVAAFKALGGGHAAEGDDTHDATGSGAAR